MKMKVVSSGLSLLWAMSVLIGCNLFPDLFHPEGTFPPLSEYPDAVLEVPLTADTTEGDFGTKAVDINSSGRVIGYTNSWNPPSATAQYVLPILGFAIDVDDTDYVDLTPGQAAAAWPLAINDAGLVVGIYRLDQGSSDVLHAYMIQENGTGFVDIHPDGYDSSRALAVTSGGIVLGDAQNGSQQHALIFPANGYPLTDVGQGYPSPYISAACDAFVVMSSRTEPEGKRVHILYRVEDKTTEVLSLPDIPPGYVTIGSIDDDGTIIGWYDYGEEYGAFSYQLGNDHAWVLNGEIRRDGSVYNQFRFCDTTNEGVIVGMVFRSTFTFPQIRAATYLSGVRDVEDVTPGEHSTYGQLSSVNDDGWAVGYAGYAYGNDDGEFIGVTNRAIAVKVK